MRQGRGARPLLSLLIGLLLLAACRGGDRTSPASDGTGAAGSTTAGAAATTGAGAASAQPAGVVEGDLSGARVRLEVQPLARAGTLTVLTAVITVVEPPEDGPLNITSHFTARGTEGNAGAANLSDVRLFAPDRGLLASPAISPAGRSATTSPGGVGLARGARAGLRAVFGALPAATREVDVLWPHLGVIAGVTVQDGPVPPLAGYGDSPPRDVKLEGVRGEVVPVTARSVELGGAVRTDQAPDQTRVVLAADVLFALDRADLSTQADAALERAAAQIEAAGPGPVKVTGHSDDQGSDQYNLDLSNRRAQAVAGALASRLAPAQYPAEVSGRGEAYPVAKGTSAEERAANRRVELLVERRQRSVAAQAPATPPPSSGPSATGADGLVFEQTDRARLRLRAERAVRRGSWLRVDLTGAVESTDPTTGRTDFLVDLRDLTRPASRSDASGVGVLDGSVLRLPAFDPTGTCACPNVLFGLPIHAREQRRFSVWVAAPASLGASVTVQLPKDQGRLLDVPVTGG